MCGVCVGGGRAYVCGVCMCVWGRVYLWGCVSTCVDLCEFFIGSSILIFKYMYLMCMHV